MTHQGVVPALAPEDAEHHYEHRSGQHQSCYRDSGAGHATQVVSGNHRDIDRVETREGFTDLERTHKILVAEPMRSPNQVFPQVGYDAAPKADRTGHQEDLENLAECDPRNDRRAAGHAWCWCYRIHNYGWAP